jgi:hypothetical protein
MYPLLMGVKTPLLDHGAEVFFPEFFRIWRKWAETSTLSPFGATLLGLASTTVTYGAVKCKCLISFHLYLIKFTEPERKAMKRESVSMH